MNNPYGIEQVDVPSILGIYQGAQDRRVNQMLMQRKLAMEDRQIAQQETISKAYRNLQPPGGATKGGGQSTPAGAGAPSPLAAAYAPAPASLSPPQLINDQQNAYPIPAFKGAAAAPTSPSAPTAPAAPIGPPAGWYEQNKGVVDQLMTVAPGDAFKMMTQLQELDKSQLEKVKATAGLFAQVGEHLQSFPEGPARHAELQRIAPDLVAEGVPADAIARADTSDKGLQWLIVHGTDMTKLWEHEKDERTAAETTRHNRATETNAAAGVDVARGNLGVRQGALGLARQREGRVASKAATGAADFGSMSTDALVRLATGE